MLPKLAEYATVKPPRPKSSLSSGGYLTYLESRRACRHRYMASLDREFLRALARPTRHRGFRWYIIILSDDAAWTGSENTLARAMTSAVIGGNTLAIAGAYTEKATCYTSCGGQALSHHQVAAFLARRGCIS